MNSLFPIFSEQVSRSWIRLQPSRINTVMWIHADPDPQIWYLDMVPVSNTSLGLSAASSKDWRVGLVKKRRHITYEEL
jgi:hypothetical protein